jgi:hypothetical protein
MEERNKWWGYKHISGTYQAKRYFDQRDLDNAYESDFVQEIVQPFDAGNRDEALEYIKQKTN